MAVFCELGPETGGASSSPTPTLLRVDELEKLRALPRPSRSVVQTLFLRGFTPWEWLSTIGGKYNVPPELYQRHLNLLDTLPSRTGGFAIPPQSEFHKTMRLTVHTILWQADLHRSAHAYSLSERRRDDSERFEKYSQTFEQSRLGDSIVRHISTIDREYTLVEQDISISITRNGKGWFGTWCLNSFRSVLIKKR